MTAYEKNLSVKDALNRNGIPVTLAQASILRRAERVLHRWAELECGDGNDHASWCVERDDDTGKPFLCTYPHSTYNHGTAIGAL